MVLPSAVRYQMVRLSALSRPLRRPAVWGSLAMLGLLAVVVPQYLHNPQWRSEYEPATASPSVDPTADLGGLSSEDLADLAEIDNLAQLLNQLQPVTSSTLDLPDVDAAGLALPQATPEPATVSPFAAYLERSRFRFSPTPSGEPGAGETLPGTQSGQRQLLSPSASATETPSPLQQALNQRLNAASESSPNPEPSRSAEAPAPSGLTPPPWMVEGSLPGVDQRFIRTTPQMSPPPGTTGYTQPPGVAPSSAVTSPQVAPAPVNPAPLNLEFGAPVTAPVGGQGRSQPNPLDNRLTAPPTQPSPPPFSAPRPPGVYTGNGYINTFSDPSGPVD